MRAHLRLGLLLLWLASLALLLIGLGGPPLRDWDEGIVARVSLELSQMPWPQRLWPTYWGEPYLNKPPGLHLLVAAAIDAWRGLTDAPALPPAWLLRLVPALISSLLVPLLALLQWRLRPGDRLTALLTGAIALTLLPLARHGHLLMLDGSQLVAMTLLWWAVLGIGRSRPLAHSLVAGLATSALLLLKAPVALPMLAGTLLLRLLEPGRRRLPWAVMAVGLALGLLPGLAWHGGHLLVRGPDALQMWLGQGFARVGAAIEGNSGGPLTPILEVLEGGWPWLPLWPFGLALAWGQRRSRAGLWCLGLTVLTAVLVLPLQTQLPWYSLLLWPPFALVCAPMLAWLVRREQSGRPPGAALLARVPRLWTLLGTVLLLAGLLAAGGVMLTRQGLLAAALATGMPSGGTSAAGILLAASVPRDAAASGLTASGLALASSPLSSLAPSALLLGSGLLLGGLWLCSAERLRRRQGLGLLLLADWLALALLFASPLWLWELNETWPMADGLALLQGADAGRDGGEVRLWRQGERPSLSWYAGQRIRPEDHVNLPPGETVWLLGLESAQAPGLRCELKGQRGTLRLEHCRAVDPIGRQERTPLP
jgi:4-amino-4-deoxy-L-arabinose transferase-like glycosyltransferase